MRTEIGHLHLRLPSGFEHRAHRLSRLVGEALARRNLPIGQIERLVVGPVTVDPGRSDRAIANHIAETVHAAIGRQARGT